jgi:hypothetical protein
MDFTCVNCSKLTAATLTSDDLMIFKCNSCDMEYRLITGRTEECSARNANAIGKESINKDAMPISVKVNSKA